MSSIHKIVVSHSGQTYSLELPAGSTLSDLRQDLEDLTDVPATNQKILLKGKALPSSRDSDSLHTIGLPLNDDPSSSSGATETKLLLIGAKAASLSAFVKEGTDLKKRYEAVRTRETGKVRKTPDGLAGRTVMDLNDLRRSGNNAYGKIEVLPRCPNEDLRKERLVKLSKDEAVLDCMKKRDWTVGMLSELHPHTDPTLLGLNRNAGEAIFLRIMTDDLSGLRSYFHTRMVLLHELTHNKFGDHDENFKTLNSLLNKEVKAFEEAKRAGAHRLGGAIPDEYEDEEELEDMCGSAGKQASSTSALQKKKKSEGRDEGDGLFEMEQRRLAMLDAAERRRKAGGESS